MTLLLKYAPWIAGVLVIFGAGLYSGYKVNPWHGRYTSLQLADAQARADGEAAVRKTLQGQLDAAKATSANNAQSMVSLANENAKIAADRDANFALARRLLAGQARQSPASGGVPQAGSGQAPPAAGGAGQDESIAGLLVDAADECDRNANRLDALIAELKPQL